MPYCRACGIEVGTNTAYCPDCGEELNFGTTETVVASSRGSSTVEETETIEPELEPDTTPDSEPEPESTAEQAPEPTVEDDTEPPTEPGPTVETEPKKESTLGVSIWAKIGVVIAIPISLAGLFLEVASVYTLSIGEYTFGQFVLVSVIFGLVAFLPIAYIYWVYHRSTWSLRGVFA